MFNINILIPLPSMEKMSSVACVNVYARYIFTGRMKGTCMNEDYDGKMQGYASMVANCQ